MRSIMRSIIAAQGFILVAMATSSAADCNPKDFTFADVEKSNISDTVKIMSYSFLEKSRQEASGKDASASAYYEAPIGLSYSESKSLAEKTLEENKFNFDRSTVKAYVRTALSKVGASMYSDCLAAQTIHAEVNSAAYRAPAFFLDIQWTPKTVGVGAGDFSIRVINGTVEGEKHLKGSFKSQEQKQFEVSRDPDRETQISIAIDGQTYPTLEIPPVLKPVKFQFLQLQGKASVPRDAAGNVCKDFAFLVSENGSAGGPDSKSCTLCAARPTNGVLLPSTAAFQGPPESKYVHSKVTSAGDLEVCGQFYTIGPGKGGGRAEVPKGSTFSVWAAIPE
ncbi:hypothetical protein ELG72_28020 (plasmid) [Rhizobium leguminosarum]|uniref:hypothetical protein n=1 Tax=Rhizobium leguminosarum TaxID=384 RepID=UPI00103214BB|nr:hypothetical protein [Rhizobium leguminosarum]MBY5374604.1 hypothetical protein [Rhizobium leguminosarum]TBF25666.1 hypothetical protein ELG92_33060 [Rhizobium leguminosarum]TBF44619.1 hypothetical protein ELG91_32275 [Rhizobium leguminosarum]TBF47859.1 hypothetical protein ELG87_29295 [Rhizobium leguminosarum]TBF48501.1 hypothetical protein ELG90_29945 [Rhizobium leguminosarum]